MAHGKKHTDQNPKKTAQVKPSSPIGPSDATETASHNAWRTKLKLGMAGLAVAGAAGVASQQWRSEAPRNNEITLSPDSDRPWGKDFLQPIDLDKIDAMYAHYYDEVKEALKKDKELVIHIGEMHDGNDSLLVELMFLDIGARLGIKNLSLEWDEASMEKVQQKLAPENSAAKGDVVNLIKRSFPTQNPSVDTAQIYKKIAALWLLHRIQGRSDATHSRSANNGCAVLHYADMLGLNPVPFDTLHTEREGHKDEYSKEAFALNDKAEAAMSEALEKERGPKIVISGEAHLPPLVEASGRKHEVLAYDAANADLNLSSPGRTKERNKVIARIYERLRTHPMPRVIVEGRQPTLPEALCAVIHASVQHQFNRKELSEAEATHLMQAMSSIDAEFARQATQGVQR